MKDGNKPIDNILKDFLISEAEATDLRIITIRHFLTSLNNAVDKYINEIEDENIENRKRLIKMIDDMAEIYRTEISDLLVKRGKLQHYMDIFQVSSSNVQ